MKKYNGLPDDQVRSIHNELSIMRDRLEKLAVLFSVNYQSKARLTLELAQARNKIDSVIRKLSGLQE